MVLEAGQRRAGGVVVAMAASAGALMGRIRATANATQTGRDEPVAGCAERVGWQAPAAKPARRDTA